MTNRMDFTVFKCFCTRLDSELSRNFFGDPFIFEVIVNVSKLVSRVDLLAAELMPKHIHSCLFASDDRFSAQYSPSAEQTIYP